SGESRDRRNVPFLYQAVPVAQYLFRSWIIQRLNPGIALCLEEYSAAGPSQTDEPRCMRWVEMTHFYFAAAGSSELLRVLSVFIPRRWNRKSILIEYLFVVIQRQRSAVLRNGEHCLFIW